VSALDSQERTIWFADAHHHHGKRFVMRADEMLTAFVELSEPRLGLPKKRDKQRGLPIRAKAQHHLRGYWRSSDNRAAS